MLQFDFTGPPFPAEDDLGRTHELTPLYRLRREGEKRVQDRSPEYCVGLRTADHRRVARVLKGRYRLLHAEPPTVLLSCHPDAV